jgi:DNA-binding LacI/PurR family transcriptional regulator
MAKDILYQKVYNIIRDKVLSNELAPGSLLEPERALMTEYEVSRVTIRKALSILVKDGYLLTRPSVGYEIIDQTPKIKSKENLIGVILNDGNNPENFFMLSQLENKLTANHYSIILGFNKYNSKVEDDCITRFRHLGLKGLIVSPATTGSTDSQLNKLIEEDFPTVLLGQPRDWKIKSSLKDKIHVVCEDNEKCIFQCLRHLEALGHEEICFVKPNDLKFTSIREKSFLKLRGKKSTQIIELENKYGSSDNYKIFKNLVTAKKKPTAFIAYDNTTGFRIIQGLQKLGVLIPEDFSVISIGQINQESLNQFPITNIEAMENEWADKVFISLESQIIKQKVAQTLLVNHELAVRGSTARVATLEVALK